MGYFVLLPCERKSSQILRVKPFFDAENQFQPTSSPLQEASKIKHVSAKNSPMLVNKTNIIGIPKRQYIAQNS
jgi:hypothetical protein